MSQNKKLKSEGNEAEDERLTISENVVEQLNGVQAELEKVNDEADEKILAIEQVYNLKRLPLFKKRNEVLKDIDLFWQKTLLSHPSLSDYITDDDSEALGYCEEVFVEEAADAKSGYKITFKFRSCPFFSNTELLKQFTYNSDGSSQVTGTDIDWKEGYEPVEDTQEVGKKRAPSSRFYAFFKWLSISEVLEASQADPLAEAIKEDVWVNPIKYFFSEIDEEDGGAGDEGEDEDGEGSEELEFVEFEDEGEEAGEGNDDDEAAAEGEDDE